MRGGQTPVLIQRWAPSDFQDDEEVRLMLMDQDWRSLVFYRQFLDHAWIAGGDLPADARRLAAKLILPVEIVEHGLARLRGVLIHEDGERLYQKRIRREIEAELAYRAGQARHGRASGRARRKGASAKDGAGPPKGSMKVASRKLEATANPPAPAPSLSDTPSQMEGSSSTDTPPRSPPSPKAPRADARPPTPSALLSAIPDFPDLWRERLRGMARRPTPSAEAKQLAALAAKLPEVGAQAIRDHVGMLAQSGWQGVAIDRLERFAGNGNGRHRPAARGPSRRSRAWRGDDPALDDPRRALPESEEW